MIEIVFWLGSGLLGLLEHLSGLVSLPLRDVVSTYSIDVCYRCIVSMCRSIEGGVFSRKY